MTDPGVSQERCYIDVGGWIYCSSPSTLQRSPTLKSMLTELSPEQPSLFVDRDGVAFRHILNFLRSGTILVDDGAYIELLIGEAKFYGLPQMESLLLAKSTTARRWDMHDLVTELRAINIQLKHLAEKDGRLEEKAASATDLAGRSGSA